MLINRKHAIERLQQLLTGKGLDRVYAIINLPNPVIKEYEQTHKSGEAAYPDPEKQVNFWTEVCTAYPADLEDDSVPNCYLWEFDQGLIGGIYGADVQMIRDPARATITSMTKPVANSLEEVLELEFNENSIWWQRYLRQVDLYAKAAGKYGFGISHLTILSGLNYLGELLGGSQAYLEVIDKPELAREAMAATIEINRRIQDAFFARVPLHSGGTASYAIQWMPGRVIAESVDAYHMTDVSWFENFGREVLEKMVASYDGMMMHLHSNGMHLLERMSTVSKMQIITLGDDLHAPFRIYERLAEFDKLRANVPLAAAIPIEVLKQRLKEGTLTPNTLYYVRGASSVSEANQLMEQIRSYRA